jgi:hypothetical protein
MALGTIFSRRGTLSEEQIARRARMLEGANAVLLGLAAVAIAFAGYRSALLGSDALRGYSTAVTTVSDANQAYTQGTQQVQLDQTIFLEYTKALNAGDEDLALYFKETLARPELVAAIDWWIEQGEDGPITPFDESNPEYTNEFYDAADALSDETDATFASAKVADTRGNQFDLAVAIFATALFLYGISAVSRAYQVQLTALLGGTGMFIAGGIYMMTI